MKYIHTPKLHNDSEIIEIQRIASSTRKNGVILEIGTFLGGTTNLLRETSDASVQIHTIDINQDTNPTKNLLASKDIHFHSGSSSEVAKTWHLPIDFLFIDGGHRLIDTYTDYCAYSEYLTESSTIAFHDYDEPIVGGVYYIGVRIFVDTLIRIGALTNVVQHTSLIVGKIDKTKRKPNTEDIYQTLKTQAEKIKETTNYYMKNIGQLFDQNEKSNNIIKEAPSIDYEKTNPTPAPHRICKKLNQFYTCYITDKLITTNRTLLTGIIDAPVSMYHEMMRWLDAERRIAYPHTCSHADIFSDKVFPGSLDLYDLGSIEKISRFVTLEQVRLNMMSQISNKVFEKILTYTEEHAMLEKMAEKIIVEKLTAVIYGMNESGKTLHNLLQTREKFLPFGVVDKSMSDKKYQSTPVLQPNELSNPSIDLIVITARASSHRIYQDLQKMQVTARIISLWNPENA